MIGLLEAFNVESILSIVNCDRQHNTVARFQCIITFPTAGAVLRALFWPLELPIRSSHCTLQGILRNLRGWINGSRGQLIQSHVLIRLRGLKWKG